MLADAINNLDREEVAMVTPQPARGSSQSTAESGNRNCEALFLKHIHTHTRSFVTAWPAVGACGVSHS